MEKKLKEEINELNAMQSTRDFEVRSPKDYENKRESWPRLGLCLLRLRMRGESKRNKRR